MLDHSSTSATDYTPVILAEIREPIDRRGRGFSGLRSKKQNANTSSNEFSELPPLQSSGRNPCEVDTERQARDENGSISSSSELSIRLSFLRLEAEIEGINFSDSSLSDFLTFLRNIRPRLRPAMFLNDNGNLRAVWRTDQREQVGLEFLGDGNLQFVIFKRRNGTLPMARISGIDTSEETIRLISDLGAKGLLFG